jgi:hypothetical protein
MNEPIENIKLVRATWRTNAREIAEALGIPLSPNQWVELKPFADWVDIVRWERGGSR